MSLQIKPLKDKCPLRSLGSGHLLKDWFYDSLGRADRERITIAPRQVIPAPIK